MYAMFFMLCLLPPPLIKGLAHRAFSLRDIDGRDLPDLNSEDLRACGVVHPAEVANILHSIDDLLCRPRREILTSLVGKRRISEAAPSPPRHARLEDSDDEMMPVSHRPVSLVLWDVGQVCSWLEQQGFSQYVVSFRAIFTSRNLNGTELLLLDEEELEESYGVEVCAGRLNLFRTLWLICKMGVFFYITGTGSRGSRAPAGCHCRNTSAIVTTK